MIFRHEKGLVLIHDHILAFLLVLTQKRKRFAGEFCHKKSLETRLMQGLWLSADAQMKHGQMSIR